MKPIRKNAASCLTKCLSLRSQGSSWSAPKRFWKNRTFIHGKMRHCMETLSVSEHELGKVLGGGASGIRTRVSGIKRNEPKTEIIASIGKIGRARKITFYLAGIVPVVPVLLTIVSGTAILHVTLEAYHRG